MLWCTSRNKKDGSGLSGDELEAIEFMKCCLELDPSKRITADEALEHSFLSEGMERSEDGTY